MDWIDLDQDKDQWRALINTAINLWEILGVAARLAASQEGRTCMELAVQHSH
jgi:hypothetical protein